ncbi:MAG: hypothetical protein RR288_06750 [Oscillibacter sp.]
MVLTEQEKRRAENLIWASAADYTFRPDLKAFDAEGRAELYWNCVIGAARRHYDWTQISALVRTFQGSVSQMTYENLLWLGLENAVYLRERSLRPVLPALREQYARRAVDLSGAAKNDRLLDVLEEAHFRRALGETPKLKPRDSALLDGLEWGPELDTAQVVARVTALFTEFLGYAPQGTPETAPGKSGGGIHWFAKRQRAAHVDLPAVRGFGFGFGDYAGDCGGTETAAGKQLGFQLPLLSGQTEEGLRQYIRHYFGAPLYEEKRMQALEKQFCTDNHSACHLYFTRGVYADETLAEGNAGFQKRAVLKQIRKNTAFYQANLAQNRNSIARLSARIRNSMLAYLESSTVKSAAGRLVGGQVWRGLYVNDEKIFRRELRQDAGNLSVDILLDASTSQLHRQELVATQAYIIAESLNRCGLPTRVYSFCSMSGYTVVNLFRDYGETDQNEHIFNYFTTGCNRDGLAIRVAAGLLAETDCEHKLLMILSDAKPNDVVKMALGDNQYRDYTEADGVDDTAAEVHRAKMNGISLLCVFTGNDADLPAAQKIYGRDFTRIRALDQFADTVGALIQNQIRNL